MWDDGWTVLTADAEADAPSSSTPWWSSKRRGSPYPPVALLARLGIGRVGQAIAAAQAPLRKVRTPQSKVVGNAHPG